MQVWSPLLCHPSLKPPMMLQAEWQEASGHSANLYVSLLKKKKTSFHVCLQQYESDIIFLGYQNICISCFSVAMIKYPDTKRL